ncbi:DUF1499 domain-containing protein [Agrobacterium sp.]|uniref:DUF1499 domain-containing protein n=1 Tax=Agrobacterium sp. TaxID=361 RepID=UPI0028A84F0E|nr:DUF1499 domain-containing protein [Agrobacterium sp.]
MAVRFVRPVSRAAAASRYFGLAALCLLVFAVPLFRFGPLTMPDFVSLALIAAGLALVAVLLAAFGLYRLWVVGSRGGLSAFKALILSALPLGVAIWAGVLYWQNPVLYDVSTDISDVPEWISVPEANQQWFTRPAITPQTRLEQAEAYPGLTGRRYEGAVDRIYQAARKVAAAQGIRIAETRGLAGAIPDAPETLPAPEESPAGEALNDEPPANVPVPLSRPADAPRPMFGTGGDVLVQGATRTLILGARFDVLLRLREETETTLVDIRVASRFGPHDLGTSASIADAYLQALDTEMQGGSGD